jgi:hemolysin III
MTPPVLEDALTLSPSIFAPSFEADSAAAEAPEVWSTRLSLLGAILAVPALWLLLAPSIAARSMVHVASFAGYGAGLLCMFLASALYHSHAGRERKFSKCLDYGAIGVMVAGNFTPYCTLVLRTPGSYHLVEMVWALALGALILRVTRTDLTKWAFVAIFMVMGCMGFLIAPALWRTLGPAGVLLTALGGAIYTAGTMFFNRFEGDVEPPGFGHHDVWHLFILAAAGTHWLVLYLYMLPR